jgi:hypothetical protein
MWYAADSLGLLAVTSLARFAACGLDKRRAARGGRPVFDAPDLAMILDAIGKEPDDADHWVALACWL